MSITQLPPQQADDQTGNLQMSVFLETWPSAYVPATVSRAVTTNFYHIALWVKSGSLTHNGQALEQGCGCYLKAGDKVSNDNADSVEIIRFVVSARTEVLSPTTVPGENEKINVDGFSQALVLSETLTNVADSAFLRLDEVQFPPGAQAYRHTHPGPGIRYLVYGSLQLDTDHGTQIMTPGAAWFEDANSPVKATASESEPSLFVRLMLLPPEYAGKGTLTLLNDEDKHKPRLQTNQRHFDQTLVW